MSAPQVTVSPAHRLGRPAMCGISTATIAGAYWCAEDVEGEYGLSRHELLVALWFEATYGGYRRQWTGWAKQVGPVLWNTLDLDPDAVELPPTR
jgi:hypothetical protein